MCGNVHFTLLKKEAEQPCLSAQQCSTADVHTHESGGDIGMTSDQLGPRTLDLQFPLVYWVLLLIPILSIYLAMLL